MMLRTSLVALIATTALLAGCKVDHPSSSSDNATPASSTTYPLYEPLAQDAAYLPFPNDLLFNGTTDATLNIPGVANSDSTATPDMTTAAGIMAASDPQVALNTMSGFSTTAMLTIPFSQPVLDDQTNLAQGIRIFQTSNSGGTGGNFILGQVNPAVAPTGIDHELAYGVDFVASVSGNTVAIVPLKPLQSATSYIVVVTTSLQAANGNTVVPDPEYKDARTGITALGGPTGTLAQKINGEEALVASYSGSNPFPPTILQGSPTSVPLTPGDAGNIALSYSVTTQNLPAALQQAQGVVAGAPAPTIAVGALPTSPVDVNGTVTANFQAANTQVYVGQISGMTSFLNPSDPVHSIWSHGGDNLSPLNSFAPDARGTVTVPVLVTAPDASAHVAGNAGNPLCSAAFPSGYPVVVFQHGITGNRGQMLPLAGALTSACAVGIAIDLPEHGIFPADTNFGFLAKTAANGGVSVGGPTAERLVSSGAGTPSPSNPAGCFSGPSVDVTGSGDYRCAAGDSYIDLVNLANSRDVLRQSVVDLDSLYRALSNSSNVGMPGIDTSKISFVGMSLGSIVGETFVATLGNGPIAGSLTSAVFNVGGGGIAKLLDGSPEFEPVITAGLAAQGVTKPSADYESFLIAAQTLVDSADPINYADQLNDLAHGTNNFGNNASNTDIPTLFQEVVGNEGLGGANAPDQVVPNNVFGTAFGSVWGIISGSGQIGWLSGQNPLTNPSALGGADSLVQGTAFLSAAQAVNAGSYPAMVCVAADGPLCDLGINAFFGMDLTQVGSSGASGSGVVRFTSGTHSSLLDPTAASGQTPSGAQVTTMMQTQIANFIGSAVAGGASVVGESACSPTCTGTIADWTPPAAPPPP
jgi:hypothetical protein